MRPNDVGRQAVADHDRPFRRHFAGGKEALKDDRIWLFHPTVSDTKTDEKSGAKPDSLNRLFCTLATPLVMIPNW